MNNYFSKLLFLFFAFITTISAQEVITGTVSEKNDKGIHPLVGVNLFWVGTQSGTTTDSNGKFSLPLIKESKKLIVSMIGYKADTIEVTQAQNLDIVLSFQTLTTGEVVVTGDVKSTYV
ncbi:MAG: carboxypeptidase-like regulatory domain-containing protein, partial [Syntrophothermus sp.]